jgi:hypothetical protein
VVDFGHEIIGLLSWDSDRLDIKRGSVDKGASGARSLDGHVEHGVQRTGHSEDQGASGLPRRKPADRAKAQILPVGFGPLARTATIGS